MLHLSRHRRTQLIQLLSLLLLLQAFFPMQLHTQLKRDAQGALVEVCTLHGFKTIVIDDQGQVKEGYTQDADRSAAMALSDLMTAAISDVTVIYFAAEASTSYAISYYGKLTVFNHVRGLKPIRAPPLLIV